MTRQPSSRLAEAVWPGRSAGVRAVSTISAFLALLVAPVAAQRPPPWEGGLTRSLGQPRTWHLHAGAGAGWIFEDARGQLVTEARLGTYMDLTHPVKSLLGIQAEGYGGARGTRFDWGFRAQVVSPYFRIGAGIDYNGLDDTAEFLLSTTHPIRRGGLLGYGSHVRLNYLPGREHSWSLGVEVPIGRRTPMGRTRPASDAVDLPPPRSSNIAPPTDVQALFEATTAMGRSAEWVYKTTVPFLDHREGTERAIRRLTEDLLALRAHFATHDENAENVQEREVRTFHAHVDRAFSIAVEGKTIPENGSTDLGRSVANAARAVLLEHVLLPYDALLGRNKDHDNVRGLGAAARGVFVKWLMTSSGIPESRYDATQWTFVQLIEAVEGVRELAVGQWQNSRYVWLPLQLALRPEEHDSQEEIDRLVERATGRTFSDGNQIWYLVNEQFSYQLGRMIHDAESYHVLWIHDFAGRNRSGEPDEVGYNIAVNGYLQAMIDKVRAYDRTGTFPIYMIFIDQWFYQLRDSRRWLSLLEQPLSHEVDLPTTHAEWAAEIEGAQEELRRAVRASRLLQAEADQFGEGWLENRIKVHVSVTNPADISFRTSGILPYWGVPDNAMRDHRKIAFYDITEADPYRGRAMYTGHGVGEWYNTLTWEDRAVLVQGPAALEVKSAARELLLTHGLTSDEIPYSLRPDDAHVKAADYELTQVPPDHASARALEIHNQTGHNPKLVNVAKAALFTLMPAGSLVKAPDPMWNFPLWGGMLAGLSLRGGRVLVISPSEDTAPVWGFGQLALSYDLIARLVIVSEVLGEQIEEAGGLLEVGVFAPESPATDIPAKVGRVVRALEEYPFLRKLYNLHPDVYPALSELFAELQTLRVDVDPELTFEGQEGGSKLHLKATFLASAPAWEALLGQPDWAHYVEEHVRHRIRQVENRAAALVDFEALPRMLREVTQPMIRRWTELVPDSAFEDFVFYLMVGSSNQNYRSFIMDGEVAVLVSGWASVNGLMDFVSITCQSIWIEDLDQLEALLPKYSGIKRLLAELIRLNL